MHDSDIVRILRHEEKDSKLQLNYSNKNDNNKEDTFPEKIQLASEAAGFVIVDWRIQENTWFFQGNFFRDFGFSSDHHILLEDFINKIHPDDKERMERILETIRDGDEKTVFFEGRLIGQNETSARIVLKGKTIAYSKTKKPSRFIGFIVAHQQTPHFQSIDKDFFDNVLNNIDFGISVLDKKLNIIYVNKKMNDKYATKSSIIGKKCYRAYQNRDSPCLFCPSLRTLQTGKPETEIVPYVSETNEKMNFKLTSFPLINHSNDFIGIIEIVFEVDRNEILDEKLMSKFEQFNEFSNKLPDIIFEMDLEGDITYINSAAYDKFGYTTSDLEKGINAFQLILPEDRARARENFDAIIRGKEIGPRYYRATRKDGSVLPISIHSNLILENKEVIGIRGIISDISAEYDANERFKLAAMVTNDLLYEWDLSNDTLKWFGDVDKALGYDKGEIPHTIEGWVRIIHPEDQIHLKDSVERHRRCIDPIMETYRVKRKDGSWRQWEDKGVPVLDRNNHPVKWIGGCNDVTEKKRVEDQLRKQIAELESFQNLSVDRELKMIALKKEINELCEKYNEKPRYTIVK